MIKLSKLIKENKNNYKIYHNTYTSVINEIKNFIKKNKYTKNENEFSDAFIDAFNKPKPGKTYTVHLNLYKNNKKQKKMLHAQIYNRGTKKNEFELNMYIN